MCVLVLLLVFHMSRMTCSSVHIICASSRIATISRLRASAAARAGPFGSPCCGMNALRLHSPENASSRLRCAA